MVTPPTKVMPWEDFFRVTDNANKLMDRVWYCIACSDAPVGTQKIFWEHWYWNADAAGKDLKAKDGSNHTKTIEADGGKEVDYPLWPLKFSKDAGSEYFKMYPAISFGCCTIAPFSMMITPLQFPTNDSRTEFRADYCEVMGKRLYFLFALDPHISAEAKKQGLEKLKAENGVQPEWFHFVQWPADYVIGSSGEPDINPR